MDKTALFLSKMARNVNEFQTQLINDTSNNDDLELESKEAKQDKTDF